MKKRSNNLPFMLRAMRWAYPRMERYMPWLAERVFRLVFYVPLTYRVPEKETEMAKSATWFSLHANGKKVQCYQWGKDDQPYVLLVHGWAGRATQFRKFIPAFNEAGFRVIGFDGPAHGKSEGTRTSIMEFEQVVIQLVEKLGKPTGVVTHSFGGAAMLYAAMNGLVIPRLVNIASPSMEDEILKTYLRAINGSWVSAERFKQYVIRRTGKSFEQFTGLYAIQRLPRPIDLLVIQDEDDEEVLMVQADTLIRAYPKARLFKTSGLGHNRVLKDEGVIKATIDFIRNSVTPQ
ncbi:MAG TPA: alpha/beta fold hydrolase [Cyclobacteriaceae bacterium]|nr:alpha/beta fold hydrolase [Cyclobacteriaceae bacterium]